MCPFGIDNAAVGPDLFREVDGKIVKIVAIVPPVSL
jgi:hypothetical protein